MKKGYVWRYGWMAWCYFGIGMAGLALASMEWNYVYDSNGRLAAVYTESDSIRYVYSAADNLTGFRQVMDGDGDGLPDEWEKVHFGGLDVTDGWVDSDGDGVPDYEEWVAGTHPVDAGSFLRVTRADGGMDGNRIYWGSETARRYRLERGTNMLDNPAFLRLTEGLDATPPVNIWLDATATNSPIYFYRVITIDE